MYGNEPPQGYYPEEEERYSQSELEEQDFQRYRDYVISEEHNYAAPENHDDAAPVHYSEPPREPTDSCKYCDGKGNMRGPYQDPFPHYGGLP